jgi:hypothetical protein
MVISSNDVTCRKTSVSVARSGGAGRQGEGVVSSPDVHSYQDARLRIVGSKTPQALDVLSRGELDLKVLSVIWNDGDAVVLLHRTGSWEDWLRGWRRVDRVIGWFLREPGPLIAPARRKMRQVHVLPSLLCCIRPRHPRV